MGKRTTTLLRNVPDATRSHDCQDHDDGVRQDRGSPRAEEDWKNSSERDSLSHGSQGGTHDFGAFTVVSEKAQTFPYGDSQYVLHVRQPKVNPAFSRRGFVHQHWHTVGPDPLHTIKQRNRGTGVGTYRDYSRREETKEERERCDDPLSREECLHSHCSID